MISTAEVNSTTGTPRLPSLSDPCPYTLVIFAPGGGEERSRVNVGAPSAACTERTKPATSNRGGTIISVGCPADHSAPGAVTGASFPVRARYTVFAITVAPAALGCTVSGNSFS